MEHDKSVSEITSAERKRVYTSLQQTHLGRLEDAGMIQFDGDTVELTDRAREMEVYLDIVPAGSISWSIYYLGLALVSSIVTAAVWADLVPPELVSESVVLVAVVGLFGVSAVAHVINNRQNRLDKLE